MSGHTTGGKRSHKGRGIELCSPGGLDLLDMFEAAGFAVHVECTVNETNPAMPISGKELSVLVKLACPCGNRDSRTEYWSVHRARPDVLLLRLLQAWTKNLAYAACSHVMAARAAVEALPNADELRAYLQALDVEADADLVVKNLRGLPWE